MNKEELLKAIEQKRQEIWPTDTGEMAPANVPNNLEQGWLNALKWMKDFINTLPSEQPSEEVEEAAKENLPNAPYSVKQDNLGGHVGVYGQCQMLDMFKSGADWQKEQMMKNCLYDTEVMLHTKQNNTEYLTLANDKLPHIPVSFGINVGDKVKVIIVKEDEQ